MQYLSIIHPTFITICNSNTAIQDVILVFYLSIFLWPFFFGSEKPPYIYVGAQLYVYFSVCISQSTTPPHMYLISHCCCHYWFPTPDVYVLLGLLGSNIPGLFPFSQCSNIMPFAGVPLHRCRSHLPWWWCELSCHSARMTSSCLDSDTSCWATLA